MKQVYIVRHAKSSWDNFELSDHDRPLMPAGIRKTEKIITFLNSKKVAPELIISSSAVRAYETAKLIAEGIGYNADKIIKSKAIYHAGEDEIYDELFSVDNHINSVMIVGHNPTLTNFVNNFVRTEIDNLPTTGVLSVEFKTNSWALITKAKFKVKFVIYPRMLP